MLKDVLKGLIERVIERTAAVVSDRQTMLDRTSPQTQAALRSLYLSYQEQAHAGRPLPSIWDTGLRVFSQFDEDGMILFLLAVAGVGPRKFVDIGAGDGVYASNCANLALNFGFHGLFIEASHERVRRGEQFYSKHPETALFPPVFRQAMVKQSTINQLISAAGFEGEIDLLSIDIDGNDYWIWEAIRCLSPRVVVMETHVEFGMHSIVVPYQEDFLWRPGQHPHYLGASPVAMTRLAQRLGYRLVGANRYGFNLFYLRNDLAQGLIPELAVGDVLRHDRNKERMQLFDAMKHLPFVKV
jgi:hypothetical protein